ncbi:molecular chaperone [Pantoea sp. KPR_PJ]
MAALLTASLLSSSALASVTIIGTRVIYPASEKEVTVRLDNRGDKPALVQTWIDDGDANQALDKINVPFVLLPPVFRMEANKGQTLRMMYTGNNLPASKESIFYLNVLDIPPKDKTLSDQNKLQMAVRSRIKIFFRPASLDAEGANQAASSLVWRKRPGSNQLTAVNHSPYFVSVSQVTAKDAAGRKYVSQKGDMLAPGETKAFTLKGGTPNQIMPTIHYQYLDDYGAARDVDSQLSQ